MRWREGRWIRRTFSTRDRRRQHNVHGAMTSPWWNLFSLPLIKHRRRLDFARHVIDTRQSSVSLSIVVRYIFYFRGPMTNRAKIINKNRKNLTNARLVSCLVPSRPSPSPKSIRLRIFPAPSVENRSLPGPCTIAKAVTGRRSPVRGSVCCSVFRRSDVQCVSIMLSVLLRVRFRLMCEEEE